MTTTTFLTGATGFIGAAVARTLINKGHSLRVLSRPGNDRRNLAGLNVSIIEGDLLKPETYQHALAGCHNLFHVAADYRLWVPDARAMHDVNIQGTQNLMLAAQAAGVQRIVYTSSVATLGLDKTGQSASEQTPSSLDDMIGVYKQSKYLAEAAVMDLIKRRQLPAVIVNPTTPIGPRDVKPTPTGRIIVDAVKGRMPAYVDTGLNIVHVDDVAQGHWLAFERGKIGERYILGGDNLALSEILGIIAQIDGHNPPKIKLPCKAIYPVALLMELAARLTGCEPRITTDALRMAENKMYFSSTKAERELGYQARPAHAAIADAISWFRGEGYF
ncbi:NAD-dependent epimerase/dehydratase family protein [Methylomonas paludis]|uniref:NAD-dependent epimerase/dehydratase family protein n=1 Tax=Methylomonas paludis TaxID=1173101 RepID=A0A975MQ89_9GAMM|nr:hopanoid-associated sugar epimerase [Methylomonas paludis]QWF71982.1 NAD-dependent epimerase/dehydratase family protein [Methylomonas paludis]